MTRITGHMTLTVLLFLTVWCIAPISVTGQIEGCTDPQALNFDPGANWNDGSCFYAETFYTPDQYLPLPDDLRESSGLIYWMYGIWSFNDSGGDPCIYKVDTSSGEIVQQITISNGQNVDWEDMAQDDDYIYIGDFGNNNGNRKDLVIYKIAKANIPSVGNAAVEAEIIAFEYADQENFIPHHNDNEYDCEAMISSGDNLYLFTKNWVSETSRLYALSKVPGNHSILPMDTLNTDGLVTGADFSAELEQVVLCGYRNYVPFIFLLFDYHENNFLSGNKRRITLSNMFGIQTEGTCYKAGYRVFLSCEESSLDQQVFTFKTDIWTDPTISGIQESMNKLDFEVHPNPVHDGLLRIEIQDPSSDTYHLNIYDSSGKVIYNRKLEARTGTAEQSFSIQIPDIRPGIYLLHILSGELSATETLIFQ